MSKSFLQIKLLVLVAIFGLLGFSNNMNVTTVDAVKKTARHYDVVVLVGQLTRVIDSDRYEFPEEFLFADATGEVKLDIDDDLWRALGVTAGPVLNRTIKVMAKVDQEYYLELDALQIQFLD